MNGGDRVHIRRRRRRHVKDDDEVKIGEALDPKKNPLTYSELHYGLGGLAIGFVIGIFTGAFIVIALLKFLGG